MDACTFGENSKRQRVFEESNCENEDRISNLPECVLHYILSFLPTKYAVATCVLSIRWKYLWASVHNLDFCDHLLYSYDKRSINHWKINMTFSTFVDRVLRLNNVSNIQKFSLNCDRVYDAAPLNKWICNVISRNVQELILYLSIKGLYVLPDCLLTCESLEMLKIRIVREPAFIHLPASICFSRLKVLHLDHISFSSEQSIQDVSLYFHLLEEFYVDSCRWLEMKTVNISAPTLQRVTIFDRWNTGIHDCRIRICVESIISLRLMCCDSYNYSVYNLSSLGNAYLDIRGNNGRSVHRLGMLLREISSVKDLELTADSIEAFSGHLFPLTHLTHLTVFNTHWTNSISGRRLVDLLSNMPNMEYLSFPGGLRTFIFKGQGRMIGTTPPCFLSCLKVVDFSTFREKELCFVRFLMKSTRLVDKLRIKVGKCKERVTMQLEKLARDSNCVVEFSSEDN